MHDNSQFTTATTAGPVNHYNPEPIPRHSRCHKPPRPLPTLTAGPDDHRFYQDPINSK